MSNGTIVKCCGAAVWREATSAEMAGVRVVSLVMFVLLGLLAAGVPAIYVATKRMARGAGSAILYLPAPTIIAQAVATGLLACGWLFCGINGWLWRDGSLERVFLNAWFWDWTLAALADFYELQEPMRSGYYPMLRRAGIGVLVAAAVLGGGVRRQVALLTVLPLAALVLYVATLASPNPRRAAWSRTPPPSAPEHFDLGSLIGAGYRIRPGLVLLVCVALAGLWCIVTEPLTPEYGGPAPLWLGFALMALAHLALVLLGFAMAHMHVRMDRTTGSGGQENVMIGVASPPNNEDGASAAVAAAEISVETSDWAHITPMPTTKTSVTQPPSLLDDDDAFPS